MTDLEWKEWANKTYQKAIDEYQEALSKCQTADCGFSAVNHGKHCMSYNGKYCIVCQEAI